MRSWRSISPTDCWDETRRLNIARRFGSAMISNTDSTLLVYFTEHIRVKVYKAERNGQQHIQEVGEGRKKGPPPACRKKHSYFQATFLRLKSRRGPKRA